MSKRIPSFLVPLVPMVLAWVAHGQEATAPPRRDPLHAATDLAILYAGYPGGEREARFVEFLEQWFPEVQTISLDKLCMKTADGFDVVIADWRPRYKDGKYQSDADPRVSLGPDYCKPTITIGAVGAAAAGGKIDWL